MNFNTLYIKQRKNHFRLDLKKLFYDFKSLTSALLEHTFRFECAENAGK